MATHKHSAVGTKIRQSTWLGKYLGAPRSLEPLPLDFSRRCYPSTDYPRHCTQTQAQFLTILFLQSSKKQGYEGHTTNIKGTMPLKDNHSLDSVKFPRHFPKTHCLQHSYMFSNYPSQVCIIINATGTTTNVSIKMFTLLYKQLILKTGNIRCTRKSIYYLL